MKYKHKITGEEATLLEGHLDFYEVSNGGKLKYSKTELYSEDLY